MKNIAIRVENISKRYRINLERDKPDSLGSAFVSFLRKPFSNYKKLKSLTKIKNNGPDIVWALKNISFEIEEGTILGVIGKNGAGKSSLLKILSQIINPTNGKCEINGRVASLLEVGTGFHPELTGRENVFLNGTFLGMSKIEIEKKFIDIVKFSGISRYLDTPVKRYSSGMRVRLAFAVAAHLEPEILLIDEVLAVGDSEFQNKCIGKINEISKKNRTVLFVSHNMSAIRSLCTKVLFLDNGEIKNIGKTNDVLKSYLSSNDKDLENRVPGQFIYDHKLSDNGIIKLHSIKLLDEQKRLNGTFENSDPIYVEIKISLIKNINHLVIGIDLKRSFDELVFRTFHNDVKELSMNKNLNVEQKLICKIPGGLLNGGAYHLYPCIGIHRKKWIIGGINDISGVPLNIHFNVPNNEIVYDDRKPGSLSPLLNWEVNSL